MTQLVERVGQAYLTDYESFAAHGAVPAWLRELRENGIRRFAEAGFPTRRDEEWRFTNVGPIAETTFHRADGVPAVQASQLKPFWLAESEGAVLVFVNGRYVPGLSSG